VLFHVSSTIVVSRSDLESKGNERTGTPRLQKLLFLFCLLLFPGILKKLMRFLLIIVIYLISIREQTLCVPAR